MKGYNRAAIFDFVGIGELADTTRHVLSLNLASTGEDEVRSGEMNQVEQMVLRQAQEYLGRVREGFMLSVRTNEVRDRSELRFLIERVLLDWERLSEELDVAYSDEIDASGIEQVRNQLLAFGMAAVALGALPRIPKEKITFPRNLSRQGTYADIPVPRSPGEMLQRIEELERIIWQMTVHDIGDLVRRRYAMVRRTYGFFESSAWLALRQGSRFGVGKNASIL